MGGSAETTVWVAGVGLLGAGVGWMSSVTVTVACAGGGGGTVRPQEQCLNTSLAPAWPSGLWGCLVPHFAHL